MIDWNETSPGKWVAGDYRIWFGDLGDDRKYHVSFRGSGRGDWEYGTMALARAFAEKHARCWRELNWEKVSSGHYVSECGHYRIEQLGRDWILSFDESHLNWHQSLSGAKRDAQDDAIDRALAKAGEADTAGATPQIEQGVTVADVLVEAIGAIANGTEAEVSAAARAVLVAAAQAVQRTWTPSCGGLGSTDSDCVIEARLGMEVGP